MREWMKSNYLVRCGYLLFDDFRSGRRYRSGDITTDSGMAHAGRTIEESVRYVERVFADYKRYSGVKRFYGRVAEVGPGDNAGIGLMFMADGCKSVDLVDRFYSRRNVSQNRSIYEALQERHQPLRNLLREADLDDESSFAGIVRRYGDDASAEEFFVRNTGYDFIVSRAVMEHVYNPELAVRRMAGALNPGGMLLHKVDLRDHHMFTPHCHELKFLEVPDILFTRMIRSSGRPNRFMAHEYGRVLADVMPDHQMLVTRLAGVGDIEPHCPYDCIASELRNTSIDCVRRIRPRLARSLQSASDEELSVAGVFIVARKTLALGKVRATNVYAAR
jgi:SAM-dependent methyltransferase